ncbi:MAG: translation initiation factor [candidate division FCPU426 bacterium]
MDDLKARLVYSDDPSRFKKEMPGHAPGTGKAVLRLERKGRAGKTVTVVERLAISDDELRRFLKALQQLCGTGGTVKEHRLELQGDHQTAIKIWLQQRGYRVSGG